MTMKILAIGDVVGRHAVEYLRQNLWRVRGELGCDFVVANGENASDIYGLSKSDAETLLASGVDLITLGNHAFGRRDLFPFLGDSECIIRPANYPPLAPGGGYSILKINGIRLLGINVLGTAFMDSLACPFATVERILEREHGSYDISLLDIHAESTSEKVALGLYFDGKIDIIFGTHTHIQTADERILPNGSAYITDIGMTGPRDSVIGSDAAAVIERMRTKISSRLTVGDGPCEAWGAIFELDISSSARRVSAVRRVKF